MDSIVLAGGFAQRLYPTTEEIPKPLITVAGLPAMDYLLDELKEYYSSNEGVCYFTVNEKYAPDFDNFLERNARGCFLYELVVEPAKKEEEKMGPNLAVQNVIETQKNVSLDEGLVIVAGDSVSSLSIGGFVDFYRQNPSRSVAAVYDIGDCMKASRKYGVVKLDSDNRITDFQEKPEKPFSSLVNTTYYALCRRDIQIMADIISMSGPSGDYIDSLVKKGVRVDGYIFEGYWFDIGNHESLAEANRTLRKEFVRKKSAGIERRME